MTQCEKYFFYVNHIEQYLVKRFSARGRCFLHGEEVFCTGKMGNYKSLNKEFGETVLLCYCISAYITQPIYSMSPYTTVQCTVDTI